MKTVYKLTALLMIVAVIISCGPTEAPPTEPPPEPTEVEVAPTEAPEPEPTEEEVVEPEPEGLTCEEPIKVGLITDLTGGLAIYGTMIQRSFLLFAQTANSRSGPGCLPM